MRHFMLAADGQLHDLHSKLRLDHPGGQAMQLHKCIVSGSTGTLKECCIVDPYAWILMKSFPAIELVVGRC